MTTNFVDFKIIITKNYKLQCSTIDSNNTETNINIQNNKTKEYLPSISFGNLFISICQDENDKTIEFIQKWIENPEDYTEQQIKFQNKEFKLLPEVLFAIIISEFKNTIEKKFLINDTIVEIPSRDSLLSERIRISLQSIGLKNIFINPNSYDYTKQEEQLNELLEMKKKGDEYKRCHLKILKKK